MSRTLNDPNVEGFKIVSNIGQLFWNSSKKEYVNGTGGTGDFQGGFMVWPAAVATQAVVDAARVNKNYEGMVRDTLQAMDKYFNDQTCGFSPTFGGGEFYSDDSAQAVLCYITGYEVTQDKQYLDRAVAGMRFLMGMADRQQGGVLWKMGNPGCNTVSTAECGMAAAMLALHVKNNEEYIKFGYYCFKFLFNTMLDGGLMADGIEGDGLNHTKWTYNQGTPLTLCAHMYTLTKDEQFYKAAHDLAKAACDTNNEMFDRDTGDHNVRYYRDSLKFYQLLVAGYADYLMVFGDRDSDLSQAIVNVVNRHLFYVFKFMAFPGQEGLYSGNLKIYDIDNQRRDVFNAMTGESQGGNIDNEEYKGGNPKNGLAPNLMNMGAAARVFFQSARIVPHVNF